MRDVADKKVAEAAAAAKKDGATDQDRLALANAYFDAGSYGAAADIYGRLPSASLDRDARLRYARSLAWSNQLDQAEGAYFGLLKEQSTPDLQLEYGRVLSWMGAQKASVDALSDIYNKTPTEDAAIALANAKAWSGDRDGAIALLNDFAQSHPDATRVRPLIDQLRASPDVRIERIGKIIAIQPYNLSLRVLKAQLLIESGHNSEALNEIQFVRDHTRQKIAGLDELEQRAKADRSATLSQLEERRKALDAQSSMASSSQNPDEILALARSYVGIEAYPEAERLYQRYLDLRPNDTDARIQYARVLSWDSRWSESQRQYEMLLSQYPDRADLRYEYARVLSWGSQFGPAIHTFRTLTDLSSNTRHAHDLALLKVVGHLVDALVEQGPPVIRLDAVQRADDVVERVGHFAIIAVAALEEGASETADIPAPLQRIHQVRHHPVLAQVGPAAALRLPAAVRRSTMPLSLCCHVTFLLWARRTDVQ